MKKAFFRAAASALIAVLFLILLPSYSSAAESSFSNYEKAIDLKILGLLANKPENFELGRTPNRLEGAVMLVRLLGKEDQAKAADYPHPFTDVPAWADHYVGYLYHNGLTKGTGSNRFGSYDLLNANQYAALVLRSLGYKDGTDFEYKNALTKSKQLGMLNGTTLYSNTSKTGFNRNDMVGISYGSLSVKLKNSNKTLLDKLVDTDNAVNKTSARVLGLYTGDLRDKLSGIESYSPAATNYGICIKSKDDLFKLLRKAIYQYETQIKLDIRNYMGNIEDDFESARNEAIDVVTEVTGVEAPVLSWKYTKDTKTMTVDLNYRCTKKSFTTKKNQFAEALKAARHITAELINSSMSDYDKEKLLHDYIINNTRYDYNNYIKGTIPDESYEAYGCLVLGKTVCEGYSKAMKLLCDLSGIECMIVTGRSLDSTVENHAWNIVKIDGSYYHIDVTKDDPVSGNGDDILAYYYFNQPDSQMKKVLKWDTSLYPRCNSTKYNYYYKNGLVAASKQDFIELIRKAKKSGSTCLEIAITSSYDSICNDLSSILFSNGISSFTFTSNDEFNIIKLLNIKYS